MGTGEEVMTRDSFSHSPFLKLRWGCGETLQHFSPPYLNFGCVSRTCTMYDDRIKQVVTKSSNNNNNSNNNNSNNNNIRVD